MVCTSIAVPRQAVATGAQRHRTPVPKQRLRLDRAARDQTAQTLAAQDRAWTEQRRANCARQLAFRQPPPISGVSHRFIAHTKNIRTVPQRAAKARSRGNSARALQPLSPHRRNRHHPQPAARIEGRSSRQEPLRVRPPQAGSLPGQAAIHSETAWRGPRVRWRMRCKAASARRALSNGNGCAEMTLQATALALLP